MVLASLLGKHDHLSIVPHLGGGGVSVTSASEDAFIRATLTDMGAPQTSANINSLASWFPHEFPSWPPPAQYNPMASKEPASGSWDYLSNGVQSYPNATEGASATAATLTDGYYPEIDAALRSGDGICGGGFSSELLTWSGGG